MNLANLLARHKNAFICDLAETYQIYDWRQIPIRTLGILAAGLRYNSRVVLEESGEDYPLDTLILASIADTTRYLLYSLGAKKGDPLPPSIVESLRNEPDEKEEQTYLTGDDFNAAREAILQRINNG